MVRGHHPKMGLFQMVSGELLFFIDLFNPIYVNIGLFMCDGIVS